VGAAIHLGLRLVEIAGVESREDLVASTRFANSAKTRGSDQRP
jgi:hypothetical protein